MDPRYTSASPEQWKPIPGFPDYRVSSQGRVVSLRRKVPHLMQGGRNQRGYLQVTLIAPDGSTARPTVHRLVAEAFIGPAPDGLQVCHNDGDNSRNVVDNLRYDTPSANVLDQVAHGRHYFANKTHCPSNHPYDADNTYVNPSSGKRLCRACRRSRSTVAAFRAAGIAA